MIEHTRCITIVTTTILTYTIDDLVYFHPAKNNFSRLSRDFQMVTRIAVPSGDGGLRSGRDFIAPRFEYPQLSTDDQVFPGRDRVPTACDRVHREHADNSAERQPDLPRNWRGGGPRRSFAHGLAPGKRFLLLFSLSLSLLRLSHLVSTPRVSRKIFHTSWTSTPLGTRLERIRFIIRRLLFSFLFLFSYTFCYARERERENFLKYHTLLDSTCYGYHGIRYFN